MRRFCQYPVCGIPGVIVALATVVACCSHAAAEICDDSLVCPTPSAGHACFSGQLFDMETSAPVREATPSGTPCSQVTVDGPCSVRVAAYDALHFLSNPSTAGPLPADITVDDCGRYLVSDFPVPDLGFAAFATDEILANGNLVLSASPSPVTEGQQEIGFPLYVVQVATDQEWMTSAGDPFSGQTFSEVGVFVAIFLTGAMPTNGVLLIRADGPHLDDDYYFADWSQSLRTTVDPLRTETGANGSALMVNSPLMSHTGTGGELQGCGWPSELGKSVPGAVVVHQFHSRDESTGDLCQFLFFDGFESGDTIRWSGANP